MPGRDGSRSDACEARRFGRAPSTNSAYRKEAATVTEHRTGPREEWLSARHALLEREKEHTYSTSARGLEFMLGFYGFLDRAPRGRDEGDPPEIWIRRHDEYEDAKTTSR